MPLFSLLMLPTHGRQQQLLVGNLNRARGNSLHFQTENSRRVFNCCFTQIFLTELRKALLGLYWPQHPSCYFQFFYNLIIIIIMCHDLLPPSRRGSNVKLDCARIIIEYKSPRPYTRHLRLYISCCTIFTVYRNRIMQRHSTHSQVINHQRDEEQSENTKEPRKNGRMKLNQQVNECRRTLHSFPSFSHYCVASIVIHLMPRASFTPSIQPNLGISRTHPSVTSAIP